MSTRPVLQHTADDPPGRTGRGGRGGRGGRSGRGSLRSLGLVLAALAVLAATLLGSAGPAAAHAALADMEPAAEQVLDTAPGEVRLTFTEAVTTSRGSIRVFDPSARELGGLEVRADGRVVSSALPDLDEQGSYTVAWRVVSADGHPISGAYLFHVGEATLSEPVEAGAPGSSTTSDAFRAIGAVLALAGLALCLVAAWLRGRWSVPRWWGLRWAPVVAGTTALLGGAIISVGSSASDSFGVVLETASGRVAVAAVVLAFAGLVASVAPVPRTVELALVVFTTLAVALQGHAVSLPPVVLSAVLTAAHVLAALVWAAGLLLLERRSWTDTDDELRTRVERWSPRGMVAVVVLAFSGGGLVVDRVPLSELLASGYGRLALVKLAILAVAVLLAWRNRQIVEPEPAGSGDARATVGVRSASTAGGQAATRLRRGLRVEVVVLATALIAGAVLAQVPPPAGDGELAGGFYADRRPFGDGQVELTVEPGTRGMNEVHVTALGNDGRLMADVDDLVLGFELDDEGIGPIEPEMQPISPGHSSAFVRIPLEGRWTATVVARVDRFTELTATFEVPIGR